MKNILLNLGFLALFLSQNAFANEENHRIDHANQILSENYSESPHDSSVIFHAFTLEADSGEARDGNVQSWDLNGWVGGDYNRLWLKSEGEVAQGGTESSNVEILYGRNISQFWDFQMGARLDFQEESISYLEIGFEGLAPQSFETEIHGFLSEDGDFSLRLRQEVDIFLTQWLITQPYLELEAFSQDVANQEIKSGISRVEIGIITRYEITRKFAPYFALKYDSKTFSTADLAKKNGNRVSDFSAAIGIRLRF